jgi:hypothetical protein
VIEVLAALWEAPFTRFLLLLIPAVILVTAWVERPRRRRPVSGNPGTGRTPGRYEP